MSDVNDMSELDSDNNEPCMELTFDCTNCNEHWISYRDGDEDDACPNCGTENSPTQAIRVPQTPLYW